MSKELSRDVHLDTLRKKYCPHVPVSLVSTDHDRGAGPQADLVHAGGVPLPPLSRRQPILCRQQAWRVQERVHVRRGGQVPQRHQVLRKT